jgi:hypothetical protein
MSNDFLDTYLILPTCTELRPHNYFKKNNVLHTEQCSHVIKFKKQKTYKNINRILDEEYHEIWKHHKTTTRRVNYPKIVSIYGIITDIRN